MSLYRKLTYPLLIILLFMAGLSRAQTTGPVLRYDSTVVKQIRPTETKEHEVFEEVDLGFAKEGNGGDNPVSRFFAWLMESLFGNTGGEGSRMIQWAFLWALVVAGVVMAVWLFRKSEFGSFLRGNTKEAGFNFSDVDEDISGIDFDARIRQAKESRDFRLAVRWLYLKQLYLLNENGKITWQPYKTNMDYSNELAGSPLRQPFRELSKIYEYVWYGDYPMSGERFPGVESEFVHFERQAHV